VNMESPPAAFSEMMARSKILKRRRDAKTLEFAEIMAWLVNTQRNFLHPPILGHHPPSPSRLGQIAEYPTIRSHAKTQSISYIPVLH
jgi:hypothetical protein